MENVWTYTRYKSQEDMNEGKIKKSKTFLID